MRARLRRSESIEKAAVSDSCANIKLHLASLNVALKWHLVTTLNVAHVCHYTAGLEKVSGNSLNI